MTVVKVTGSRGIDSTAKSSSKKSSGKTEKSKDLLGKYRTDEDKLVSSKLPIREKPDDDVLEAKYEKWANKLIEKSATGRVTKAEVKEFVKKKADKGKLEELGITAKEAKRGIKEVLRDLGAYAEDIANNQKFSNLKFY